MAITSESTIQVLVQGIIGVGILMETIVNAERERFPRGHHALISHSVRCYEQHGARKRAGHNASPFDVRRFSRCSTMSAFGVLKSDSD